MGSRWGQWMYHATLVNGGGAGRHDYAIVPAVGSLIWLLYGHLNNGDTVARNATWFFSDDTEAAGFGNIFTNILATTALSAGTRGGFPKPTNAGANAWAANPERYIWADPLQLHLGLPTVAATQDTTLSIVCDIRGQKPTVVNTFTSGGSETVNHDRMI